jgi:hypothetical protein
MKRDGREVFRGGEKSSGRREAAEGAGPAGVWRVETDFLVRAGEGVRKRWVGSVWTNPRGVMKSLVLDPRPTSKALKLHRF